jgi:hypothetical protein
MHVPPDLEVKDFLEQLETEWVRRTSHRHVMRISQADDTTYAEWHVCKGFFTDPDGELLSKARRMLKAEERAIPDAGIAIRLAVVAMEVVRPGLGWEDAVGRPATSNPEPRMDAHENARTTPHIRSFPTSTGGSIRRAALAHR